MLVDDLPNKWKIEDGYRIREVNGFLVAKGGLGTVITHLTDENTEGELGL